MEYVNIAGVIGRRLGPAAAAAAIICALTACVPSSPEASPGMDERTPVSATETPATETPGPSESAAVRGLSEGTATPTPIDARPTADPEVSGRDAGGPAYEGTGAAPPLVDRGGPAIDRVSADKAPFESEVKYPDGVVVGTTDFSTGTVDGEGSGVVPGARYVLFTVSIRNGSSADLDLSAVVPTLQQGEVTGAPLYDGVDVADFAGILPAGATASARYAFQLPGDGGDAALYLDLDAVHAPAVFSGLLP